MPQGIETLLQDDFMAALPMMVANINDQRHRLAWITDQEAEMLKEAGGSGKPGPLGIQSFYEDETEDDDMSWDDDADFGPDEASDSSGYSNTETSVEAEGDIDLSPSGTVGSQGISGTAGTVSGTVSDLTGTPDDPNRSASLQEQYDNLSKQSQDRNNAFNDYVNDLISRDEAQSRMGITDREFDDLIDRSTVADAQARANALGFSNVNVSMNPDGTLSYSSPDASAVGFGLSQMGRAGAQAIGTGFEMGRGMMGMMPGGMITDFVTGREKSIGGDFARSIGSPTTGTISDAISNQVGIDLSLNPDAVERGIADFFR